MSEQRLPVRVPATAREVTGVIEGMLADVPPPHTHEVAEASAMAQRVARDAAKKAALLSGSLALPSGPLGMLTVLPDLYLIWKVQRQMVSDLFGLYGRSVELTQTHMLYCLFRHMASHVMRDIAVRAGQRVVVEQLTAGALKSMLGSLGVGVTQRLVGTAAGRWIPLLGAAAVGGYAYWDTLQVAKTAQSLLDAQIPVPIGLVGSARD